MIQAVAVGIGVVVGGLLVNVGLGVQVGFVCDVGVGVSSITNGVVAGIFVVTGDGVDAIGVTWAPLTVEIGSFCALQLITARRPRTKIRATLMTEGFDICCVFICIFKAIRILAFPDTNCFVYGFLFVLALNTQYIYQIERKYSFKPVLDNLKIHSFFGS